MAATLEDAGRLRRALARRRRITEKPMFGGLCFLLRENMLCLWSKRGFLFRVGPEQEREALARPGAKPMVHAGRRMRGAGSPSPSDMFPRCRKSDAELPARPANRRALLPVAGSGIHDCAAAIFCMACSISSRVTSRTCVATDHWWPKGSSILP